ncbi:MAG: hypothetical protein LBJ96_02715 [Holosporaceae bacterium]|jgi:hypothetical protein|nr:hypothetical protein [Holosporaceae bacterium]
MKKMSLFFLSVLLCSAITINAFGILETPDEVHRLVTVEKAKEFGKNCTGKTAENAAAGGKLFSL